MRRDCCVVVFNGLHYHTVMVATTTDYTDPRLLRIGTRWQHADRNGIYIYASCWLVVSIITLQSNTGHLGTMCRCIRSQYSRFQTRPKLI